MAVGGLVAVGVANADIFAVAAFRSDLFDVAVAGGENRRAIGRAPVDPGMQFADVKHRMGAPAERRRHRAGGDGLADEEFLRADAAVVIIVVNAVVGGLVAIIFLGLAAH